VDVQLHLSFTLDQEWLWLDAITLSLLDAALMTDKGIESFNRTEAYEWAKRRGNPDATITSLQGFKLAYAMILADFGFNEEAEVYVRSTRQCLGLSDDSNPDSQYRTDAQTVWALAQTIETRRFVDQFEERLSFRKNAPSIAASEHLGKNKLAPTMRPENPKTAPSTILIPTDASDADISFLSAKSSLFNSS
jgi:hypothetical protein